MAATRSIEEWMASDIILTDPLKIPAANFNKINKVFEIIERRAILALAFIRFGSKKKGGKNSYKILWRQNKL
jgi:hypothetical protein